MDHGIDGEIDLVSPDGTPLNIVVMTQSKARGRPFAYETDDGFQRAADPADPDYWLSANAPVDSALVPADRGPGLVVRPLRRVRRRPPR